MKLHHSDEYCCALSCKDSERTQIQKKRSSSNFSLCRNCMIWCWSRMWLGRYFTFIIVRFALSLFAGQLTSVKLNRKSCWSYYVQAQMVEKRLLVGDNRYITVEGHQAGVGEAKVTKNVEDLSHVCWGLQTSFHLAQPRSATVTIFWQCWSRLLFWWVNDKYFINQPSFATWDFIISPYSDYMHVTANPESSEEWMKKEEAEIPV